MCHIDSGDIINCDHITKNVPLFYAYPKLAVVTSVYTYIRTNSFVQNIFGVSEDINACQAI
jgi:hypothetical protein